MFYLFRKMPEVTKKCIQLSDLIFYQLKKILLSIDFLLFQFKFFENKNNK